MAAPPIDVSQFEKLRPLGTYHSSHNYSFLQTNVQLRKTRAIFLSSSSPRILQQRRTHSLLQPHLSHHSPPETTHLRSPRISNPPTPNPHRHPRQRRLPIPLFRPSAIHQPRRSRDIYYPPHAPKRQRRGTRRHPREGTQHQLQRELWLSALLAINYKHGKRS